jgi:hypothetical protein
MLHWRGQTTCGSVFLLGEGSTKFLFGTVLGATTGFAAGFFIATPTARSAGKSTLGGLDGAGRFVGRTTLRAVDSLGLVLESGYTRLRGREKYLEHEIEELREQITRLEQRID